MYFKCYGASACWFNPKIKKTTLAEVLNKKKEKEREDMSQVFG